MRWIKDPDAKLDFGFGWSKWLKPDDRIINAIVTAVEEGVTIYDVTWENGVVVFWIRGGVDQETYHINCHIVTLLGREDDRSKTLRVFER